MALLSRAAFDALLASAGGGGFVWEMFEREREAWAREREAWAREREASRETRETLAHEREAFARERDVLERERLQVGAAHEDALAQARRELDVALGHSTVRSVLEQIADSFQSRRPVTQALQEFCKQEGFEAYLGVVSQLTHISAAELASAAKGAYAYLSASVHHGSTLSGAVEGVPHEVMSDRARLYGVAAIFKFAGRDVRFYMHNSRDVLRLPTPPRSLPPSGASSTSTSPAEQPAPAKTPVAAALIAAGGGGASAAAALIVAGGGNTSAAAALVVAGGGGTSAAAAAADLPAHSL
jgi:hypothetical protein